MRWFWVVCLVACTAVGMEGYVSRQGRVCLCFDFRQWEFLGAAWAYKGDVYFLCASARVVKGGEGSFL